MSPFSVEPETALEFSPLTAERWPQFERLFGSRGACGGCWCMWFRLTNKDFEAGKGERNRRAIKGIVDQGRVPGILASRGDEALGWCSVAPREEFCRLARSRILRPVDDRQVWSIVCLFVAKEHRGRGVSTALLEAAVDHVSSRGGQIVEGYAVEPKKDRMPDVFAYHGPRAAFEAAGFREVARRSETRPIMRYVIE
jgi:GNAT superfamily N-acetyltransferase